MEQYIKKAAVVAEIEEVISGLRRNCNPNPLGNIQECLADAEIEALNIIKDSLNTLEVKDMSMPALDNGNMPVERWKEACEAASCQANYRKSKGLTETCDDYFVDGVQWADEHPKKAKEVDLEKEIDNYISSNFFGSQTMGFFANRTKEEPNDRDIALVAKYFFELGLKAKGE